MPVVIENSPIRTRTRNRTLPRPNSNSQLMLSSCPQFLTQRPFLAAPSIPKLRVSTRPATCSPLTRSFRISDSNPKSLKNVKWKVSCFRHDDFSSETPQSEFNDNFLPEELLKPEVDNPSTVKRDWATSFYEAAYAVFKAIGTRWSVPWTAKTIQQVMLLCVASFWFVGSWMMPFAAHVAGFPKEALTCRGQALYSLLTDVSTGLVVFAVLHRCLSRYRPLQSGLFRLSLGGNWLIDVALGCLMFPLVNQLSQFKLRPTMPSTPVPPQGVEQAIVAGDPMAMALYAILVTISSPVWEEMLFRGFLLPSLTKYMPVWSAILVSSVAFALVHFNFNVHRVLPLSVLGTVMGVIFARSRNLLPSVLLHSLWNVFVFLGLMR